MSLIQPVSARQFNIGIMVLRAVTGLIFVAHGGQKLFVYGVDGVAAGFGQMGIPFAQVMGPFIGVLELVGGIALMLGLLTRLFSIGLAFTMAGAMLLVHLPGGFFMPTGIEFTLALLGSTVMLALAGAGAYSLDTLLARRRGSVATVSIGDPPGTRRAA